MLLKLNVDYLLHCQKKDIFWEIVDPAASNDSAAIR